MQSSVLTNINVAVFSIVLDYYMYYMFLICIITTEKPGYGEHALPGKSGLELTLSPHGGASAPDCSTNTG